MIFGAAVAPGTLAASEWMAERAGAWWTVGWLVPTGYDAYLRIHAPDGEVDDWWERYRALVGSVAAVAARHTATPGRCTFGIWEGHGYDHAGTLADGWHGDGVSPEQLAKWQRELAVAQRERESRAQRIRAELAELPKLDRLHRSYYLLQGTVAAATAIEDPRDRGYLRPDLWWPDDHRWFVGTDTDFWSLYVGGSDELVDELAAAVTSPCERTTVTTEVEVED